MTVGGFGGPVAHPGILFSFARLHYFALRSLLPGLTRVAPHRPFSSTTPEGNLHASTMILMVVVVIMIGEIHTSFSDHRDQRKQYTYPSRRIDNAT